jgi:hypothetical protein
MISKVQLQSIIEKYHLNGLIENVKWCINGDKTLTINFMAPTREMIGEVVYNGIPLPESNIGINNTTQLVKLLNITHGDLLLEYAKEGKIVSKLLIADSQFNVNYALADIMTVPKPGEYNGAEDYDIGIELNSEVVAALIKAKSALPTSENVVVKPGLLGLEFTFGGDVEYANKVTYTAQNPIILTPDTRFELTYNSTLLKEILVSNKDSNGGHLYIHNSGLIKVIFDYDNMNSKYYIVAKAS